MAGKIRLFGQPYIGDSIKKPNKVIKKLRRGKKQLKVYLIVLSEGSSQLEIYHNIFLRQWYYKENPPLIIGIAGDHKEAVDLVCRITEETLEETGKADLKGYLMAKVKKEKEQTERFNIRQ